MQEAYDTLSDASERVVYDLRLTGGGGAAHRSVAAVWSDRRLQVKYFVQRIVARWQYFAHRMRFAGGRTEECRELLLEPVQRVRTRVSEFGQRLVLLPTLTDRLVLIQDSVVRNFKELFTVAVVVRMLLLPFI